MTILSIDVDPTPTISHEELMARPVLRYNGTIRIVGSEADLGRALSEIRRERIVGFDTESRPTFRKGQYHPPSLAQIAGGRAVYLFPLRRLNCSRTLAAVFGDERLVKAGIAPGRDLDDLRREFRFEPRNVVDLGEVALARGLKQSGIRNLAGMFLGGRVTKGQQTSNWAQPRLSERQMVYAATDAWVCRELYLKFEAMGFIPPSTSSPRG